MINTSIEKIKNFRRRPDNNPDNNPNINQPILDNQPNNQPILDNNQATLENKLNLKDRLKNLFYKDGNKTNDIDTDRKDIELVDNTQPIASTSNVPERGEFNNYFKTPSSSSNDIED
jgi:hypothetical protein